MLVEGSNQRTDACFGFSVHRGAFFNDVANLFKRLKDVHYLEFIQEDEELSMSENKESHKSLETNEKDSQNSN